jgi:peptidoglycan/xylan/chitin deacetylase (PgdA/CDA1 family)
MENAMHRTEDTYPLSHFRQHTGEHLERIKDGAIETITQNGQATMVVMSPARYDFLIHSAERGHIWDAVIGGYKAGERGQPADEVLRDIAEELGYRTAIGDVYPRDPHRPGAEKITRRVLARVRPGSLIILHDGGNGNHVDRSQTLESVKTIVPKLLEDGYRFVTLSELVASNNGV